MKLFLYTTVSILVATANLLAQSNDKAIIKEKIEVVKDEKGEIKQVKKVCKSILTDNPNKSDGQIIVETVSKDGEVKKEIIEFTDGNETVIDKIIDSLSKGDYKDINIDVEIGDLDLDDFSKIKVIKITSDFDDNAWFEGGEQIEWIDIDDMLEFSEIQAAQSTKPFLGVILDDDVNDEKGIRVVSVVENSAAKTAGIKKEDIIVALDDKEVNGLTEFSAVLREKAIGCKIKVDLIRNGALQSVNAVLKSKADCNFNLANSFKFKSPSCTNISPNNNQEKTYKAITAKPKPKLGVNIENLNEEMIDDLRIKGGKGVLITKVYNESAAAKIGLKINDVITNINGTEIANIADLHSFLSEQNVGDEINVTYYRYGKVKSAKGVLFEFNDLHFNLNN